MKEELKSYFWEKDECKPPSISEDQQIKEWLKLKMQRIPLSMSNISSSQHDSYTLYEMKKARQFFTIGQINNWYHYNDNRDRSIRSNWLKYLSIIIILVLFFRACSGCFSSSTNDDKCLDKNFLSHTWKSKDNVSGAIGENERTSKLILMKDGTYEVIHYKLNSTGINLRHTGTWTFECVENHTYEYGKIIDTKYKTFITLSGKQRNKTILSVWKTEYSGEWTVSALSGKGFVVDSDQYFKR